MNKLNSLLPLLTLASTTFVFGCDSDEGTPPGAPASTNGAMTPADEGVSTDTPGGPAAGEEGSGDGAAGSEVAPGEEAVEEAVASPSLFATGGLGEDVDAGWEGYLFTTTDATDIGTEISPAEGEAFVGADLCVSGTVAADVDYGGFAMLGWNISQTINEETFEGEEANEIATSGTGITYNIVNNNPSTSLRIQLQDNSDTDAGRWCADVTGTTGTIEWSDFNTTCWNGLGDDFSVGTQISSIAVQVAGTAADDVPFDFCLVDLKQAP